MLTMILMVVVLSCAAFALDIGYVVLVRTQLQNSADAAGLAAAVEIHQNEGALVASTAVQYAQTNCPTYGNVLQESDVTTGTWNTETRTFSAGGESPNAVKLVLRCSQGNGNPIPLFFGRVLGATQMDVAAEAIAYAPPPEGIRLRFLLDGGMIDSDTEAIQDLAQSLGVTPEDLVSDIDNDGFLDLPPGVTLELPTGQVGDEALFDVSTYGDQFPFQKDSEYTTTDFLAEGTPLQSELDTQQLQDAEWDYWNAPHPDLEGEPLLDPVPGIEPVNSQADILSLPNSEATYVSPVFGSDVVMAETDPSVYGSPASHLQGQRRGLLAYKIIAARSNPAGGSHLPLITLEIVDPSDVDVETIEIVNTGGEGSNSNAGVWLVK